MWNKSSGFSASGNSFAVLRTFKGDYWSEPKMKVRVGEHIENINSHNPDVFDCAYFSENSNLLEVEVVNTMGVFYINGREVKRVYNLKKDGNYLGFATNGRIYPIIDSLEIMF